MDDVVDAADVIEAASDVTAVPHVEWDGAECVPDGPAVATVRLVSLDVSVRERRLIGATT